LAWQSWRAPALQLNQLNGSPSEWKMGASNGRKDFQSSSERFTSLEGSGQPSHPPAERANHLSKKTVDRSSQNALIIFN